MLALRTGAALIPVFTVPDGQAGYVIHIGPDISIATTVHVKGSLRLMGNRFGALLEPFVAKHPAQWRGWIHLSPKITEV